MRGSKRTLESVRAERNSHLYFDERNFISKEGQISTFKLEGNSLNYEIELRDSENTYTYTSYNKHAV